MRLRLSENFKWAKYIFAGIGLIVLFDLAITLIYNIELKPIIIDLIILLFCFALYYLLDNPKRIEFDDNFLYVIDKSGEGKIPLKDIYKIKLTMARLNERFIWKITYYDNLKDLKSVRISPDSFHENFAKFKECVLKANKDVTIKNWSHSFDFDQ